MAAHAEKLTTARFVRRPFWSLRRAGSVLLTFDDGPHPIHTAEVLDQLDRFDVRAAFFLLGNRVATSPDLVRRMRQAGHQIGNHTFTHPRPTWFDFRSAHRELAACQRAVSDATGVSPTLFRPPMGRWTLPLRLATVRHRLHPMSWTLDSGDWRVRGVDDADRCAHELLQAVLPGDVILLHDYHPWIGQILERIVSGLADRRLL